MKVDADVRLTPAEAGLTKRCTGPCGRVLPLTAFYVRDRSKLTADGRRLRMSRCARCFGAMRPDRNNYKRDRETARRRAQRKLTRLVPELWEQVFEEELRAQGL